jgi:hypothetical protein
MTSRQLRVAPTPVTSSFIVSVGYSRELKLLDVEFISGDIYRYLDAPPDEYASLVGAPSLRLHLNRSIKNRFDYERL